MSVNGLVDEPIQKWNEKWKWFFLSINCLDSNKRESLTVKRKRKRKFTSEKKGKSLVAGADITQNQDNGYLYRR